MMIKKNYNSWQKRNAMVRITNIAAGNGDLYTTSNNIHTFYCTQAKQSEQIQVFGTAQSLRP
jgi:hypothetical protein